MSLEEFRLVMDVHLMSSVHAVKAVWENMRAQGYGRIVLTTSSSGLYGNFGQSNYSAARRLWVNADTCVRRCKAQYSSQLDRSHCRDGDDRGVLTPESLARLAPAAVSPAGVALPSENAPTKTIVLSGAGSLEVANITMTRGIYAGDAIFSDEAPTLINKRMDEICSRDEERVPATGFEQCQWELEK